ncbi:N-acetyltransferase O1 (Establishment of cohesion protein 1) [Arthrobotrys musiformis]|uniref:N-acetyltransferase O1 (Establishment of cohesion protein 1) n=1 Tax=Arthrobotrys musiformis TaxID=47236 RepID=A0AAV9VSA0_9PEZI
MSSSSIARIRKRPVATYSKKTRTYLGSDSVDDDINNHHGHGLKRARIAEPGDDGNEDASSVNSDKDGSVETTEPESATGTSVAEDDDDGTNTEEGPVLSIPSSKMDSKVQTSKGDTTSSISTKHTGFTISTRRKPLFKRHIAKKTSDNPSSSPQSTSSTSSCTQSSSSTISSAAKPPKPKLVQMQIDLDGIGAPKISCKECGMQYVPSADEDAKLHKRYHAQIVEGLEFGTAKGKVVWESKMENKDVRKRRGSASGKKDGGKTGATTATGTTTGEKENLTPITRFFASGRGDKTANGKKILVERASLSSPTSTCHIVEITRRSTPTEKKKAMEFLRFANKELSAQEVAESVLWGSSTSGSVDGEIEKGEQFKIYLYLEGTKCVGLCLAEKIKEAQWATTKEGGASISCSLDISETKRPALLGISRIWTCPKHRRHGIASRLVNSAVESFVYGMKVEAEMVAFSQPTDSGAWFALGWVAAQTAGDSSQEGAAPDEKGFLVYLDGV